jgi:hypothetical protein
MPSESWRTVWRRKFSVISAGVTAVGLFALVCAAFLDPDSYGEQLLMHGGTAATFAWPISFLESRSRREREALRAQIASVEGKVEDIGGDLRATHQTLAELRASTQERFDEQREHDQDTLARLRDDASQRDTHNVLSRSVDAGAVAPSGIRVAMPASDLRVRFSLDSAAPPSDSIRLSIETADGERVAGQRTWMAGQQADECLAGLADELQRTGDYPGDAAFDAEFLFGELTRSLSLVLALRNARTPHVRIAPAIEVIGDWAITTRGLEHVTEPQLGVLLPALVEDPDGARRSIEAGANATAHAIDEPTLALAVAFHRGEIRRSARSKIPGSQPLLHVDRGG